MTPPNTSPIGAATAAVASARLQVAEADGHLSKALDHLAAAASVLDRLAADRRDEDERVHQADTGAQ